MKKTFITSLVICTSLSLVIRPVDVQAIDFSKDEDRYIKLCSSSRLEKVSKIRSSKKKIYKSI